jgi:hypothetical protein
MSEVRYELKSQFEYANKGLNEKASYILLKAPTSESIDDASDLKEYFFRAIEGMSSKSDSQQSSDDSSIDAEQMILTLSMSKEVKLKEVLKTARRLFIESKCALVDGEVPLHQGTIDKISIEDFEGMVGEYLVNFILASALGKMESMKSS